MRIFLRLINPDAPSRSIPDPYGGPDIEMPKSALDCVEEPCLRCDRPNDALWVVTRVAKAWGAWPVAMLNGSREVIDGSLPHRVTKVPRDAVRLTPEQCSAVWHSENESHVFGGPNVAKALREAIAVANSR